MSVQQVVYLDGDIEQRPDLPGPGSGAGRGSRACRDAVCRASTYDVWEGLRLAARVSLCGVAWNVDI